MSSSSSAVLLDTYFVSAQNIRIIHYGISPHAELQFYNQDVISIFCNVVTKPDFLQGDKDWLKIDVMCDISSFQTQRGCLTTSILSSLSWRSLWTKYFFFFLLCFRFYRIDSFIVPVGFSAGNITTAQIWCCAVLIIVIPVLLLFLSGDADFERGPHCHFVASWSQGPVLWHPARTVRSLSMSLSSTYYPSSFSIIVLWSLPVYSRHLFFKFLNSLD